MRFISRWLRVLSTSLTAFADALEIVADWKDRDNPADPEEPQT